MANRTKLAALIIGAALMMGIGATTSFAAEGKCGAGKCGGKMMQEKALACPICKEKGECKCDMEKAGKCGTGKCGDKMNDKSLACPICKEKGECKCDKEKSGKAGKCGAGKCGGKM